MENLESDGWNGNILHPQKTYKILILLLILAIIILLIAVGLLYKNNQELKNNKGSSVSNSVKLTNIPAGVTFNGEPIDWEGGQAVDYFNCETNEDCIKVRATDCSCPFSDAYTAINKKYEQRWQVRLDSYYDICTDDGLFDPSETDEESQKKWPISCRDGAVAKCVSGECKVVVK